MDYTSQPEGEKSYVPKDDALVWHCRAIYDVCRPYQRIYREQSEKRLAN